MRSSLGLCVCGAAFGCALSLLGRNEFLRADQKSETVEVLVAERYMPAGVCIEPTDCKRVHYSKGEEPKEAVTDEAALKGKRLQRPVGEDQPLKKDDLELRAAKPVKPKGKALKSAAAALYPAHQAAEPGKKVVRRALARKKRRKFYDQSDN